MPIQKFIVYIDEQSEKLECVQMWDFPSVVISELRDRLTLMMFKYEIISSFAS